MLEQPFKVEKLTLVRRLAAATGNPYGIDDGFITLDYPVDHPGFNSSAPIRTNAMIARVTSRILIGNSQHPSIASLSSLLTNIPRPL